MFMLHFPDHDDDVETYTGLDNERDVLEAVTESIAESSPDLDALSVQLAAHRVMTEVYPLGGRFALPSGEPAVLTCTD